MSTKILDPLKVTRIAIEVACSDAASLIVCELAIAEESPSLWDELDKKMFPQNEVDDDFRQEHPDEAGYGT